ncbi:MAG TPA: thioredoxin domain-containing protein [Syntrophorhabdaceae bacterium]|nr:thioredoxin domain-containing protein [Syntrophorhabdaceae bacterium]
MFFSKTLCKPLSPAFYLLSLFLLFASFHKEASAQSVDDNFLPTFGNGKIKIRLYTDYFCGPCSHLEPQIEGLLKTLIEKHLITITFIDVPFSKYSSMYVKHFLYALNEKRSLDYAFKVRRVLFNAAKEKISDPKGLVSYLKGHNINIKPFNERGIYEVFEHYLNKEDKINATPTCVIMEGGKKEIFKGVSDITNALKRFM